ncbi:MAG: peptidylprolyl isomerase [Gammaproteobacteria bacterium]|nr:peptidylprolyl isomerase [Gammaproteobacteria bacterium]
MQVNKGKIVEFHYSVREVGGDQLEDSRIGAPMAYLHGYNNMIVGIQNALEGKQAGDHISVTLTPEVAYGERVADAIQRVSINHVVKPAKAKIKFVPGMVVQLNSSKGYVPATVVKVGLKMLDVDTNHPYAGKTLAFELDVVNVREATEEEIQHGHAHAEGGHHH